MFYGSFNGEVLQVLYVVLVIRARDCFFKGAFVLTGTQATSRALTLDQQVSFEHTSFLCRMYIWSADAFCNSICAASQL